MQFYEAFIEHTLRIIHNNRWYKVHSQFVSIGLLRIDELALEVLGYFV